ncbi:hypothetical protein HDU67_008094 [Dinochytrium kinnereticum]|nr:hypothetical protein HDU67_008094 [Dinochytrium kinnereticum]
MAPKTDFVQYDIRLSPANMFLVENARTAGVGNTFRLDTMGISAKQTLNSDNPYSIIDKKNINMISRGGVVEPYSGPFEIQCPDLFKQFRPVKLPWSSEDIVVLSNGMCGSTCAMTSRAMREKLKIKFYTYGGFNGGRPFQPTAFEGGSVLKLEKILASTREILAIAKKKNVKPPKGVALPQGFVKPVEFSQMLLWESYSSHEGNVTTPDEFVFHPADGHVVVRDPSDLVSVYKKLAKMVGAKRRTSLKNGESVDESSGDSYGLFGLEEDREGEKMDEVGEGISSRSRWLRRRAGP